MRPTTNHIRDALIHLTPLAPAAVGLVLVGEPALWLTAALPAGPLLLGPPLAGRRSTGWSHMISTLELVTTAGVAGVLTFGMIHVGLRVAGLELLIAIGLLASLAIAVNLIMLTAVGTLRALGGVVIENPGVLPLRRYLPGLEETGFGERR